MFTVKTMILAYLWGALSYMCALLAETHRRQGEKALSFFEYALVGISGVMFILFLCFYEYPAGGGGI